MNLLKKLGEWLSPRPPSDYSYWIKARCNRCGEIVQARVNLANDLSVDYNQQGGPAGYRCHKVLMGENRCFQKIDVDLIFDGRKRLKEREISGGAFVE